VAQDFALAAKWYESAAEAGDVGAQYIIASCYEHGDGVAVDLERALYWYSLAALQGDPVAAAKARGLAEARKPASVM
jgi:TPR repeat protein